MITEILNKELLGVYKDGYEDYLESYSKQCKPRHILSFYEYVDLCIKYIEE